MPTGIAVVSLCLFPARLTACALTWPDLCAAT